MIIRKYHEQDHPVILALAERFNHIDYMKHRDQDAMAKKQEQMALQSLTDNKENIYIAENNGMILGYLELAIQKDYFTGKEQAYISAIAVSEKGEGKGIGKALMAKAEEWAIDQGLSEVILDVFLDNNRAVGLYEHLGYQKEIVKMVKELS
ncbi:GNAT family N-acetyltransferase [Alkalihalobacillus trypoxylicola]|uniref:Alanine acetyltransferase n=1 Tax=Alkalihalobacillus trypoxylicola TaxID=519424 RepID=A0A162E667_9BACI|nr:GNAT family N-acetyltransferase [Alkalihalobacillus trypoxylicola]KYG31846.1 alanine acetyltransferase [Alkalihalobacillus trypoxylicola]